MSCDFFSLVLQAIGGAIADTANDQTTTQTGINIMIAGLSFQVVSLVIFIVLCSDFARQVLLRSQPLNAKFDSLRQTKRFQGFLWGKSICSIPWSEYSSKSCVDSSRAGNHLHPDPIVLPCRRAQSRFPRCISEPASHLHGSRRRNDYHCCLRSDCLSPRCCIQWCMGRSKFPFEIKQGKSYGNGFQRKDE